MHQQITMVVRNGRSIHLHNTADKLIICFSQHQASFDKQHADYRDNGLEDNMWQSITDQLGLSNVTLCSLPLDEVTSANVC